MTPSERRVFDLVKQDMDRAVEQLQHNLTVALYTAGAGTAQKVYPTPSRWSRWRVRTSTYCWTLWRALRGDELDTPYDGDGY